MSLRLRMLNTRPRGIGNCCLPVVRLIFLNAAKFMESIFEKVKERVKISEVVAAFGIALNRAGKGLCPFHEERNPSFSVKDADGIFKCFSCDVSGDIFDFVSTLKGIEALEAAELLADIFGVDRPCKTTPRKLDQQTRQTLKSRM